MIGMTAFGSLAGVIFEAKVLGANKYRAFNRTGAAKTILRMVVMLGGQLPFLWLGTVFPGFALKTLNVHPDVLFVLKRAMAVFCGNFYVFGLSRWTCK